MNCKLCNKEQELSVYVFCDVLCQRFYYERIEKLVINMDHSFIASQVEKTKCAKCNRSMLDHSLMATCESCGARGKCDIVDTILMCFECADKTLQEMKKAVTELVSQQRDIISESRAIDSSIQYNGDFFNAETIATEDIRKAINESADIPQDKKNLEFQKLLMERFEKFQSHVFILENEILEKQKELQEYKTRQLSLKKSLRDFGAALSEEIRAKIKLNDSNYIVKQVKPVVSKKNAFKTPMQRLIEITATQLKCTEAEAEAIIRKGKQAQYERMNEEVK